MKTLTLYTTVSLILFLFIIPSSQPVVAYEADGRRAINLEQSLVRSAELRIDQRLNRGGVRAVQHRNDEIIVKFTGSKQHTRVRTGGRDVEVVLAEYRNRADIEYAEPNYIAYAFGVPNDPYYQYQWNFDNDTYGGVQAEAAWGVTSGAGVTVAVLDTGIAYEDYNQSAQNRYYQAPDLADTNFVGGYDFVDNDTHANDTNGHGTHVAGTIAGATNNSLGVAGLASGATIMPVKVLGQNGAGSYADITDGIIFAADNGADVINLSLGGSASASYLEDALRYAYDKGVTIVAAAGNDGSEIVSYPAAYDAYVIAVGATRFDETLASYSNYGTALDIVAPGGDTSVDQNGDGYVDGILQQTFGTRTNSFSYYFYQGTSMATPHVAAAAALVIASGNAAVPSEVRSVLESTADDLGWCVTA
jgi:serine protease